MFCILVLIISQGMMFLCELGLPPIDHVQSGNAFVVNEVCKLGGYENTLLGYKTRIYRLCKDHLSHLDVILFGELCIYKSTLANVLLVYIITVLTQKLLSTLHYGS